jgi:putative RecB family exonuclease
VSGFRRSVSQLHRWLDCSEAYYLERMHKPKLPQRPAAWLALGTSFHEAAAQWEISGRQLDLKALFFDLYDRDISMLKDKQPDESMWMKPFRSKVSADIDNRKAAGGKMVDNYIEDCEDAQWSIATVDGKPAVEIEFSIELGGIEVIGFIDRVLVWPNGSITIRDDKTGNREKRTLQLGVYTLAMNKMFDLGVKQAEYWYAKDRGSSGFIPMKRYTESYLTDVFVTLDKSIEQRLFLPNPGDRCDLCSVYDYCREMGTEELPVDDGPEAE